MLCKYEIKNETEEISMQENPFFFFFLFEYLNIFIYLFSL